MNSRERNEKRLQEVRRKKIFLVAAGVGTIILILSGISFWGTRKPKIDVKSGIQEIKKLEKKDTAKIEAKINEIEENELKAQEEWKDRPLSEKFSNAVVMGDSITVGFLSYEVLDSSKVVAQTGVHLKDLGPLIDTAANLNPQVLFLALGLNDVALTEGDTDRFIVSYKKVLEQIRSKLPNTVIYINGVLPVTKERQEKNPIYKKIPKYNEALRDLCKEEGITFIDNEPLVEEKYYEPDGEHMGIKYYPVWAEHMAEVAGI